MPLTDDSRTAAEAVASRTGMEGVYAEVPPERKVEVGEQLQAAGRTVATVGDAAPPATADPGPAMGTGTNVAIQAGDLTLAKGDLHVTAVAIRLTRRTPATVKGNLYWSLATTLPHRLWRHLSCSTP